MPRLNHNFTEDDDLVTDTPGNVFDLMNGFYRLYKSMAEDPCFDDLAEDVASIINEIDERRILALRIAQEEEHGGGNQALH
ncbi:MAG: hypothetical protein AAF441_18675 [Pseudomonadota bacterium]